MGEKTHPDGPVSLPSISSFSPPGGLLAAVGPVLLSLGLSLGCVPEGEGGGPTSATEASATATATDSGGVTLTEPWASTTAASTGEETAASTGATGEATGEATEDPENTTGEATGEATAGDTESGDNDPPSCKKVDILLAIDNSAENWRAYPALEKMMPYLTSRLKSDFADWDSHVMVVRGDDTFGNEPCEKRCKLEGNCEGGIPGYLCDYDPVPCDHVLGAGLRTPIGNGAANMECPIAGDRRYLLADQPDLQGTLDCLRRVGSGPLGTRPQVQTMLNALSPELNSPGACNDGFFREDAYLIVFMLSTMGDWNTEGGPEDWAEKLLATKGGKFDKIFLIGLYDGGKCDLTWQSFWFYDFADLIPHAVTGHYCESDFVPYLDAAFEYIAGECPG